MKEKKICVSWIGTKDLRSLDRNILKGPVNELINSDYFKNFDELHLLYNIDRRDKTNNYKGESCYTEENFDKYKDILKEKTKNCFFHSDFLDKDNPNDFNNVYNFVKKTLDKIETKNLNYKILWNFYLYPGTATMHFIWAILGKSQKYNSIFYDYYKDKNVPEWKFIVKKVDVPFDLAFDHLSTLKNLDFNEIDKNLNEISKDVILKSKIMRDVLSSSLKIGKFGFDVLLLGETGVGKEVIATIIHDLYNKNNSRKGKLISVNCGAIPKDLLEAELFGYTKGAFTGAIKDTVGKIEAADNGTLFLDEIGELSLELQVKLLRVLENKKIIKVGDTKEIPVDFKLITATNKKLSDKVKTGEFRADLYYRIDRALIEIPPLRERKEEVSLFLNHFFKTTHEEITKNIKNKEIVLEKKLSRDALELLENYYWPGNVRELKNLVYKLYVFVDNNIITKDQLKNFTKLDDKLNPESDKINSLIDKMINSKNGFNLEKFLDDIKKNIALKSIEKKNNNIRQAGFFLGYGEKANDSKGIGSIKTFQAYVKNNGLTENE